MEAAKAPGNSGGNIAYSLGWVGQGEGYSVTPAALELLCRPSWVQALYKQGRRPHGADQLQSPSWRLTPLTVSSMGFRGAAAEVSASILRILKGFVLTPAFILPWEVGISACGWDPNYTLKVLLSMLRLWV